MANMTLTISYNAFEQVNLRSGTMIKAEKPPKARKLVYKVWADFGLEIGILQTSAEITAHYLYQFGQEKYRWFFT